MLTPPPAPWHATIFTLFPEMFPGPLGYSLAGKARGTCWDYTAVNIRDFAENKHKTVDDTPFGGGPGMVMRPDVLDRALSSLPDTRGEPLIYLSPRGCPLTQSMVKEFTSTPKINLICGRYEGIDERLFQVWNIREVSVGDYVLAGGEMAALVLMDACIRLLPGVMGDHQSLDDESFQNGLLEYPHYTRPQVWKGLDVPPVLVSGHHAQIQAWKQEQSEALTAARRPDLWEAYIKRCRTTRT